MRRRNMRPARVRRNHSLRRRLGTAVVEFAVVGPLMILLTMGMIEIGRVVMVKQLIVNASREGARLASIPYTTTSDVTNQVAAELTTQSVMGATVTTTPASLSGAGPGDAVTVKISIPASQVSWIPNPMFTLNTTLEAETTMRRENH